jgi:hypothetical protein
MRQLDAQPESVKQVAVANRLVLTKTDLATAETIRLLVERLCCINPMAPRWRGADQDVDAGALLAKDAFDGNGAERWLPLAPVRGWLGELDLNPQYRWHSVGTVEGDSINKWVSSGRRPRVRIRSRLVRPLPGRSARMIIGLGTARGGNGRTAALSNCGQPPVDAAGAGGLVRKRSGEAARSRGSRQAHRGQSREVA